MTLRTLIVTVAMALTLSACAEVEIPEPGFLTHAFDDGDDSDAAVAANGCTSAGCPQAPSFCVARGYSPGTVGYQRCIISVEQNLRKEAR